MSDAYSILHCPNPFGSDAAELRATPLPPGADSWRLGRRFPEPAAEPVEIELDPQYGDRLIELYLVDALLMTGRLLAALLAAGVDNLDAYAARIRHPDRGVVSDDYAAVNLIGLVGAADPERSRMTPGFGPGGLIDADVASLAIDPAKAAGLLMFRLAENTSAVVVHQRVAKHLRENGFDMLAFIPPEEWTG